MTEHDTAVRLAAQLMTAAQRVPGSPEAPDAAWWSDAHTWCARQAIAETPVHRESVHVKVRDGVLLAVDVYLPPGFPEAERLPTVLTQTRYYRRFGLQPRAGALAPLINPRMGEARVATAAGYAFVVVDVRGSGASTGYRSCELGEEEIADAVEVCDWITMQPWADGQIVATGISYEGSCAEHLLRSGHPAIRAVAPRFSFFDAYPDFWAPGGLNPDWVADAWGALVAALDSGDLELLEPQAGSQWRLGIAACTGPARVDADDDGVLLQTAIREHTANLDVPTWIRALRDRDDVLPDGRTIDDLAPAAFLEQTRGSGAPTLSVSGWFDGAYAEAAVKRWRAHHSAAPTAGHRLLLGPWDHGGRQLPDPSTPGVMAGFDHWTELVRFFDSAVDGREGAPDEAPVRYFTLGAGRWRSTATWPPPGVVATSLHLDADGSLRRDEPPARAGTDTYTVDFRATSGLGSRWRSWVNIHGATIGYPDRADADELLLVYDSPVLTDPIEITGHPVLQLHVAVDQPDTAFHAYLEEVRPDGEVRHVTEGVLRGRHRALRSDPPTWEDLGPSHSYLQADAMPFNPGHVEVTGIRLLPVSYAFAAGSCIRLALAGADADNFSRVPTAGPPPTWTVHRGPAHPSRVILPVVPG